VKVRQLCDKCALGEPIKLENFVIDKRIRLQTKSIDSRGFIEINLALALILEKLGSIMVNAVDSGSNARVIERSGFEPWPMTLCCGLGQDTLLPKCLSLHPAV